MSADSEMARRPTMADVAQLAKVSLKTVSRVANSEANVAPATVRAVQQAMVKLGYRRNEYARALRQRRTARMLGLVIKDVSNPFYASIARGVEEEVRDRGLLVVAGSSDEDAERERALLEIFCEQRVGGLLVVPTGRDYSFLASELALGTAIVFIDRPGHNIAADTILLDNYEGARAATEHLITYGHHRVAFIGELPDVFTTVERARGYRAAISSAGLRYDKQIVKIGCHSTAAAAAATRELLSLPDPPTAIFACNNRITFGVLAALSGLEHRVWPALVGFDDFELAANMSPPVSVVAYDPVEVGRQAARLICERLDGATVAPRQIVIPTKVLARGSGELPPREPSAGLRRSAPANA
ncbi:MAG: LacI family DNA-binding transcriptional regulator [Acidimicrobiales bacterium]